jgi:serine protease inhibitor
VNEAPTLEIANSLWLDNGSSMVSTYEQIVGDLAKPMDLQSTDAGTRVNAWVEENTNGLIDTIVDEGPFPEGSFLVAVNSIYLKASWQTAFREPWTRSSPFYTTHSNSNDPETTKSSSSTKAHFMHALNAFPYSDTALQGHQMSFPWRTI